jgi:hypothetical protein
VLRRHDRLLQADHHPSVMSHAYRYPPIAALVWTWPWRSRSNSERLTSAGPSRRRPIAPRSDPSKALVALPFFKVDTVDKRRGQRLTRRQVAQRWPRTIEAWRRGVGGSAGKWAPICPSGRLLGGRGGECVRHPALHSLVFLASPHMCAADPLPCDPALLRLLRLLPPRLSHTGIVERL